MTVTVKLELPLEERLRQCAARTGRSTSEVIRAALAAYLDQAERAAPRSAFDLGAELFGRHRGSADLARQRKRAATGVWAERHARRST